ncbi:probable chitinase 10 [Manduca sexta]|uniref:probable chitinase 10 n=1 Tax=Manduca sexta TaxID=7130 RepID=UPI00188E81CC|nr:probable chitinase 10 [Manduca sexta]
MIGKILSFMFLVGVVATANNTTTNTTTTTTTTDSSRSGGTFKAYAGIDPNTLSCDPEGHVFMLLPHFTNCAKFYMCAHGEEVEFACSGGLIFDFAQQTCNWKWAVDCVLRVPKEDIDTEGSGFGSGEETIGIFGEEIENGPIEVLTADAAGTVRPNSPVNARFMMHDLNCHRADSAARQVPYKGDCQRYWRCVAGVPQAMYCSDGLFFNEQTQQCDYEANAKCVAQTEDELQGEFIVYNKH